MDKLPNYKLQACLAAIPIFGFFIVVFYAFWYIKKRKGYFGLFGYYFCLILPILLCFLIGSLVLAKVIHVYCSAVWAIVTLDCCVFYVVLLASAYIALLVEKLYVKKLVGTDAPENPDT